MNIVVRVSILFFVAFYSMSSLSQMLPDWLANKPERVIQGFKLYEDKGCGLCHGYSGQGSPMSGPSLNSHLPFEYIRLNVRQPRNQMPLYLEETLSDQQLKLIAEFIAALPKAPNPDHIELLHNTR